MFNWILIESVLKLILCGTRFRNNQSYPGNSGSYDPYSVLSWKEWIIRSIYQSYPGNSGSYIRSYVELYMDRTIHIFCHPGNIWRTDFPYFLLILNSFFKGGPGGRRAGGVGGRGRRSHRGVRGRSPPAGGRSGCRRLHLGWQA